MNKTILGVAMVVVFCITFWIVAGEWWRNYQKEKQKAQQAEQAYQQAWQAYQQAWQAYHQAVQASQPVQQAYRQARWAYQKAMMEEEDAKSWAEWNRCTFRNSALWGIGFGLFAAGLPLYGALAWSHQETAVFFCYMGGPVATVRRTCVAKTHGQGISARRTVF